MEQHRMIIAANWKMNFTYEQAAKTAHDYREFMLQNALKLQENEVNIVAFPPALYGALLNDVCQETELTWGGQSCLDKPQGAYTGDMSPPMFASAGASWQLVGHSERRVGHNESDEFISRQIHAASEAGLKVILCVGESLAQREAGNAEDVVMSQIASACAHGLPKTELVIAYEPVWAIGTGKVASPDDVAQMHKAIANFCLNNQAMSAAPLILYGGSVNASNASSLFALPHVDGALVGGASLKIDDFAGIISACLA